MPTTAMRRNRIAKAIAGVFTLWLLASACSSGGLRGSAADAAAGGAPGSGGSSGKGGSGHGGASATGGSFATSTGGTTSVGVGGARPTGGSPATGGAPAMGGSGGSPPTDAGPDGASDGGRDGRRPDLPVSLDVAADAVADRPDALDGAIVPDARPGLDGGWGDVGSALAEFCVGNESRVFHQGQTYEAPATTKWTPVRSCCMDWVVRVHTREAVGTDFEAVVGVMAGDIPPGLRPVGPGEPGLTVTLRTNPATSDGGSDIGSVTTGSVLIGGQIQGAEPWTLGLCVLVEDPASALAGTRIYVPGVTVAPTKWANRLRFLPLADPSLLISTVEDRDLQTLELASEPLIDLMGIDYVDLAVGTCGPSPCHFIGFNSASVTRVSFTSKVTNTAPGMPFVVEADGERIYLGAIQSMFSSYAPRVARIVLDDVTDDGLAISSPWASSTNPVPDLRNDPRIVKVLTEAGKCIP